MKTSIKVKVIDDPTPPPPPFVGTAIRIRVGDGLRYKIRSAPIAEGRTSVTVEWGDGTSQAFGSDLSGVAHDYPAPGEYVVRISDDVRYVAPSVITATSEYCAIYAPMVREVFSNATRLTLLSGYSFNNCGNMTRLDVSASGVTSILGGAFRKCSSLRGELSFPKVSDLQGGASNLPFAECTGIAAIRFAARYEEVIKASSPYRADEGHTLGTGVPGVCRFDLCFF